jgi:hypothetical protein
VTISLKSLPCVGSRGAPGADVSEHRVSTTESEVVLWTGDVSIFRVSFEMQSRPIVRMLVLLPCFVNIAPQPRSSNARLDNGRDGRHLHASRCAFNVNDGPLAVRILSSLWPNRTRGINFQWITKDPRPPLCPDERQKVSRRCDNAMSCICAYTDPKGGVRRRNQPQVSDAGDVGRSQSLIVNRPRPYGSRVARQLMPSSPGDPTIS